MDGGPAGGGGGGGGNHLHHLPSTTTKKKSQPSISIFSFSSYFKILFLEKQKCGKRTTQKMFYL
jgi:hypothetical protein